MLFVSEKIEAINVLLAAVGDSPINSLTDHHSVDVYNAERMLDEVSLTVQGKGWEFNTGVSVSLQPDTQTQKIRYSPSWIKITGDDGNVYVKRGDYLYNLTNNTFIFSKALNLTIIEAVDYEDLPHCFKTYITSKAAIKFQSRYLGDSEISQMLVAEMNESYADIVQYSIDTGVSMLEVQGISPMLSRKG